MWEVSQSIRLGKRYGFGRKRVGCVVMGNGNGNGCRFPKPPTMGSLLPQAQSVGMGTLTSPSTWAHLSCDSWAHSLSKIPIFQIIISNSNYNQINYDFG